MNSQNPLVSIIIRTKNEERWISSCLQSVFNQTHKNIEVIIVDNLSTDMTVKKLLENCPDNSSVTKHFMKTQA